MSKLACPCGHVIRDQTDALPYKAQLSSDQDASRFWDALARDSAELFAATREGRRDEWISKHFLPAYPRDLDDAELLADLATSYALRFMRTLYQCEECGRLLVQERDDKNRFRSFVPEGDARADALSARDGAPE